MKRLCAFLLAVAMLLSLVGCGDQTTPMSESEQSEAEEPVTEEPVTDEPAKEEKATYKIGDIVDFGAYKWRVLDVQDSKALLLTDEIIALDYINITEEAKEAIDSVAAKHPNSYNKLSDYEGWTVFTDDKVFPEGDSFYDNWSNLLKENSGSELLKPSALRESVNWADCSLRNKLNSEMPFSDEEWVQINETEVIDPAGNGEVTYDKVFLLSTEQVEHYFPQIEDRGAKGTGLSDEMLLCCLKNLHVVGQLSGTLAEFVLDLPNGGDFYWWTIGENSYDLLGVHTGAEEKINEVAPDTSIGGIRPAIWVSTEA